jgi:hypothetical protein
MKSPRRGDEGFKDGRVGCRKGSVTSGVHGLIFLERDSPRSFPMRPGFFVCPNYCCFGAAGGLAAGAVVSAGVVFLVLLLLFVDFVFFFGVVGSTAGSSLMVISPFEWSRPPLLQRARAR